MSDVTIEPQEIADAGRVALAEDVGTGDATTLALIPFESVSLARMVARETMVLAGLAFARSAFLALDPTLQLVQCAADGDTLSKGQVLLVIQGKTRAILSSERVALNYVQRLSGVATATKAFVSATAGTHARILDTRKTTPGWRTFEKYAVVCGGGKNHRSGLHDQILIKDNHLAALGDVQPNAVEVAVLRARTAYPSLKVEVEADTLSQVAQAVAAHADIVLLDNMSLDQLRQAVEIAKGRILTEASGGVTLDTVRSIAETGVDFISVGAITHSARAMDIGLDFDQPST